MTPAFVINLDRRPDRLAYMARQLDALGMAWERVSALDAQTALDSDIAPQVRLSGHRIGMGRGSQCCAITNFRLWQRMLDEDIPAALVLQDDIALSPLLAGVLRDLSWLPPDLGVIQFERGSKPGAPRLTGPVLAQPAPGVALHRLYSRTGGAGCFLITRAAARVFLAEKAVLDMPIDHFLFSPNLSPLFHKVGVGVTLPALAVQDVRTLTSDISAERDRRRRPLPARLARLWSEVNLVPWQLALMARGARWRPFDLHPSLVAP